MMLWRGATTGIVVVVLGVAADIRHLTFCCHPCCSSSSSRWILDIRIHSPTVANYPLSVYGYCLVVQEVYKRAALKQRQPHSDCCSLLVPLRFVSNIVAPSCFFRFNNFCCPCSTSARAIILVSPRTKATSKSWN